MILQAPREQELRERLAREAGALRFVPRLRSDDPTLSDKPAAAALGAALRGHAHIVLEGLAGAGKTVLATHLSLDANLDAAYLEAPAWAPTGTEHRQSFLRAAGADLERAEAAFLEGRLVLILDAVDEAPWRPGAMGIPKALAELSGELAGRAGLLVTSRTSQQVPLLESDTTFGALGGISQDAVEAFLAYYKGAKTGVSAIADTLAQLSLTDELKYSPLLLRALADGLVLPEDPTEAAELFARLAEFHIGRECRKGGDAGGAVAGSWQSEYATPPRHTALVSGLLFGAQRTGRVMSETEFRGTAEACLGVSLDARDLVQLSTLLSQHPLVTVTYTDHATYAVRSPHDWARVGLLPAFFDYGMLDALSAAGDYWLDSLPTPEDFADAWAWVDTQGRADTMLEFLVDLASTSADAQRAAAWLAPQMFHPSLRNKPVSAKLYSAIASLSGRFARPDTDLTDLLNLSAVVPYELGLAGAGLALSRPEHVGSYSHLVLQGCTLLVDTDGPPSVVLRRGTLTDCVITIRNGCRVTLEDCFLDEVTVDAGSDGHLIVRGCLYDPDTCNFPSNAELIESGQIPDRYWPWVTGEVLRRLVVPAAQPQLARPKHMIDVENVLGGALREFRQDAQKVLDVMEGMGLVTVTPTGPSKKRVTPTRNFDTHEAAVFARSGRSGPMVEGILAKFRT